MIKTLSISLLLAIGLILSGYLIGNNFNEPETKYIQVNTYKTIPVTKTIISPTVVITKTIEKTVYELRHFSSYQELKDWIDSKTYDWRRIEGWTCVDYSVRLVELARDDGFILSTYVVDGKLFDRYFGGTWGQLWPDNYTHMICAAIIDGVNDGPYRTFYLIDPTSSYIIYPSGEYFN